MPVQTSWPLGWFPSADAYLAGRAPPLTAGRCDLSLGASIDNDAAWRAPLVLNAPLLLRQKKRPLGESYRGSVGLFQDRADAWWDRPDVVPQAEDSDRLSKRKSDPRPQERSASDPSGSGDNGTMRHRAGVIKRDDAPR